VSESDVAVPRVSSPAPPWQRDTVCGRGRLRAGGNIVCGMAGKSGTERRRGTSAYKRLYRELRDALEGGEFREGRRMPTEAELCRQYGVSRHTVRQAFQDLVAEGLVYRVPGRGTFATSLSEHGRYLRSIGTVEDLMVWSDTNVELLRPISFEEDEGVARLLELPTPEVAVLVMRRHYDGLPFALTRVYLSPGLGKRLAEKDVFARTVPNATVIAAIEPLISHPIAGASQEVTAKPAPADVAGMIGCAPGEPSLRVQRLYFDTRETPVELAVSHYHPERYSYRIELRRRL
jgi:GntR family transcriptional regulator